MTLRLSSIVTPALILSLLGSAGAHAVDRTWEGDVSGQETNWAIPANWSGNAVPGNNDAAIIANVAVQPVIVAGQAISVGRISVSAGADFTVSGGSA